MHDKNILNKCKLKKLMTCTKVQNKTKVTSHKKHSNLIGINMYPEISTEYNKERCLNNQVSYYTYNR